MKEKQQPTNTDLLRDLDSLLAQAEQQRGGVQGNIELAAARMAAVKHVIYYIRDLAERLFSAQQQRETISAKLRNQIHDLEQQLEDKRKLLQCMMKAKKQTTSLAIKYIDSNTGYRNDHYHSVEYLVWTDPQGIDHPTKVFSNITRKCLKNRRDTCLIRDDSRIGDPKADLENTIKASKQTLTEMEFQLDRLRSQLEYSEKQLSPLEDHLQNLFVEQRALLNQLLGLLAS